MKFEASITVLAVLLAVGVILFSSVHAQDSAPPPVNVWYCAANYKPPFCFPLSGIAYITPAQRGIEFTDGSYIAPLTQEDWDNLQIYAIAHGQRLVDLPASQ